MQTIILAAGDNERFDGIHKSTLKAPDGRTVLENQVEAFDADPVIFVAQRKYFKDLKRVVNKISFMDGNPRTILHAWLEATTDGPLDTLFRAAGKTIAFLNEDEPVVIAYCDILPSKESVKMFVDRCKHVEAGVMIFKSDDNRFQDCELEDHKLSGVFYFHKVSWLLDKLKGLSESQRSPENGVAILVMKAKNPRFIVCDDIVDIGTPEDYQEWVND